MGMSRRIPQLVLGLACVLLSAAGCQHAVHTDYAAFVREPRPTVVGRDYAVGVPDELVVTRLSWDGVEETVHTVGPDGTIWLADFGAVAAADRTCEAIAQELNDRAEDLDAVQGVSVRVKTFAGRKVFVFGQVEADGPQAFHGANTVLESIANARPNVRADVKHVQVLRPSADGEFRRQLTVDVDAMVRGGDTTLDVVLAEGDVVFVPPTALGSLGLAWEQVFSSPTRKTVLSDTSPPAAAVVETEPADHPATAEQIDALHAALAELGEELQGLREAQEDQALFAMTVPVSTRPANDYALPLPDAVVFTTADVERGGAGESPPGASPPPDATAETSAEAFPEVAAERPEGVRFWGP